jgi:hypothetical protein
MRPDASENSQISSSTIVRAARAAGSHPHLASVLQQGRKSANIRVSLGVIRGIPAHSTSPNCTLDFTSRRYFKTTPSPVADWPQLGVFVVSGCVGLTCWEQEHASTQANPLRFRRVCGHSQKGAAAPGGRGGRAQTRSGDGEGWGRDRARVTPSQTDDGRSDGRQTQRAAAVAGAGRLSPSASQTLGSFCDCRFTKR